MLQNPQPVAEFSAMAIATAMGFKMTPATAVAFASLAPLAVFFQAPMLWVCLAFVVLDLVTGLYKAWLAGKIRSRYFGKALERIVFYLLAYIVLHAIAVTVPLGVIASLPEITVMTGYLLKEALSVLENLKVILSLRGQDSPILDALISRLGLDLDNLTEQVENSKPKKPAKAEKA